MIKIEDKELIDRVLQGDDEAFAQLVHRYENKVYSLCLRMCGDGEEAKDLAQEAFLKAWRGLRFYKSEAAFSTWLYRLTSNVCIDCLRQKKRRAALSLTEQEEEEQIDVQDPSPLPEDVVVQKQKREAIAAAMGKLPEDYRLVLTLRVVHERSYEEIAEITDLKVGTVKSRIARAREKLKKLLLQNGNNLWEDIVKDSREGDAT